MNLLSKLMPKTIKYKLILSVALVHAVLMTIFVFDLVYREQEFLFEHKQQQAKSLAKTLATASKQSVLSNDISGLEEIMEAQNDIQQLKFVIITNMQGEVLAHTDKNIIGQFLSDSVSLSMLDSNQNTLILSAEGSDIDYAYKLKLENRPIGWVRVSFYTSKLNENIKKLVIEGFIYTLAAILIGSFFAWLIGNGLTSRIVQLIGATKDIKPSQNTNFFKRIDNDEVGELMLNFQAMQHQLKGQFDEMQNMAYRDALTELHSRSYFDIAFAASKEKYHNKNRACGLVIIDVDNFKMLNDSHGHDIGDDLLIKTARRIKKVINKTDYAFRFGGDEFVLLLTDFNPKTIDSILESVVEHLHSVLSKPCELNHLIYTPQFSVGIHTIDYTQPKKEAFKKADIALYNAKKFSKGQISYFATEMEEEVIKRSYYEDGLKLALEKQEFHWVIQPQLNMQTNKVVGGEVLLRWKYKDEFVRPDVFIPIAEDNQSIIPVSNWMFEQVFYWIHHNDIHNVKVSINLSPIHFFDSSLIPTLNKLLNKYQISPYNIKFEVTEGVFLSRMEVALSVITKLKNIGFRISLDDFGTGFSSLSYLKNLPIDQLKIDKSFIDGFPDNEKPAAIAKTIIDLTQNLSLNVIAEGVETIEQKRFLVDNQCVYCQGYLYSKPLLPDDFLAYVKSTESDL